MMYRTMRKRRARVSETLTGPVWLLATQQCRLTDAVTNNIMSDKRNTRKKNDMLVPHACKSACLEFR